MKKFLSHSRDYQIWKTMRRRCYVKADPSYHRYGGKGITVCEAWNKSFAAFIKDMGPSPTRSHHLRLRPGTKEYGPGQTEWVEGKERTVGDCSSIRIVKVGRECKFIADWASENGLTMARVCARVRSGWDIQDACTLPLGSRNPKRQ